MPNETETTKVEQQQDTKNARSARQRYPHIGVTQRKTNRESKDQNSKTKLKMVKMRKWYFSENENKK